MCARVLHVYFFQTIFTAENPPARVLFPQTAMPNWLEHETQIEANALFRDADWAQVTDACAVDMLHFLCALLTPKCEADNSTGEVTLYK